MSDVSPFRLTDRTFTTALESINANELLADKPQWFKVLIAGLMDTASLWINAQGNNSYLTTAFTRRAVTDLAALIDYYAQARTAANGTLLFDVGPATSLPYTPALEDLVGIVPGSGDRSQRRFEARATLVVPAVTEAFAAVDIDTATEQINNRTRSWRTGEKVRLTTSVSLPAPLATGTDYFVIRVSDTAIRLASSRVNAYAGTPINLTGTGQGTLVLLSFAVICYQQETQGQVVVGRSDGVSAFQEFDLPDLNVLEATVRVTINAVTWTRIARNASFVNEGPTDQVYKVRYRTDGAAYITFGDGVYGAIPGSGFDIQVDYATGGGSRSNVRTIGAVNTYGGADPTISAVSNPVRMTGGANEESLALIKRQAPLLLKARERFVTREDGEVLARAFGGISIVRVNANVYGVLSAQVLTIPFGGGDLDSVTKAALQQFLIDRTVLESVDVRVEDVTRVTVNVVSSFRPRPGFTFAAVKPFYEFAWDLFLAETGQEIVDEFTANGISSTVELINTIFGTAFTVADEPDLTPLLTALEPRQIGQDVNASNAFGFLERVRGLDVLTIAGPVFPVAVADDEITQLGTIGTTEIT